MFFILLNYTYLVFKFYLNISQLKNYYLIKCKNEDFNNHKKMKSINENNITIIDYIQTKSDLNKEEKEINEDILEIEDIVINNYNNKITSTLENSPIEEINLNKISSKSDLNK